MATAFQVGMTLVLLWTGSFESIVIYAGVGLSIFSMLAMSSIFMLRWKMPDLPRPFRTPGYPLTPAVYLDLDRLADRRGLLPRPQVSAVSLGSILAGIPFYYLWKGATSRKGDDPAGGRRRHATLTFLARSFRPLPASFCPCYDEQRGIESTKRRNSLVFETPWSPSDEQQRATLGKRALVTGGRAHG